MFGAAPTGRVLSYTLAQLAGCLRQWSRLRERDNISISEPVRKAMTVMLQSVPFLYGQIVAILVASIAVFGLSQRQLDG
ncbi:MAG: hypothetical protein OXC63_09345 [Aestuariivita sp.]|nr:hypothetical protein [Aestuariivita sp.]